MRRFLPLTLLWALPPQLVAANPSDFYTQIGTDRTFQELVADGVIVVGERFHPGPVHGSTIDVNNALLEQQTGPTGPIPQDIRIHTQMNGSVQRGSFGNWTRWYQEDGKVQVMRLFQGEQNVRDGIGPDGTPGRIEAFFPPFVVAPGTSAVWEGTYTIIKPLSSNIFQLFHEGGQLWPFHLRMTSTGSITFNRRREIAGLPSTITIATGMVGKSISFRVVADGLNYEVYKRIPGQDPDWVLVTTGFYTQAVDNRISFRWGMYHGSQAGQSIPNDGLLFVSGVNRSVLAPVSYYWDSNGAAPGFGSAQGVWGTPTVGSATQGWSTSATGTILPGDVSTTSAERLFFGASDRGLGTGVISVSGTVHAGDITFGSASGDVTLSGGEIAMTGNRLIELPGADATHTITSVLSGTGSRTIGGGGTLVLGGANTFTGPLIIGNDTGFVRLRIHSIGNANGAPSAAGAPATEANGIIQIGAGTRGSILEFVGAASAQVTNRRIRIGSNGTGSGGVSIQNNNANPAHTLTFTHPAFNVAATDTSTSNRILTLGGANTGDNAVHGAIIDNIGTTGGRIALAKRGGGTWVLTGSSTFTGSTVVHQGTLVLVGAGLTSPVTVADGASLAFALGAPAATSSSINLGAGTIQIRGEADGASDYVLITASGGINGTPTLSEPIPGYALEIRDGGTRLVLAYDGATPAFTVWSRGAPPEADSSGDGIANGIAWALGAASRLDDATALLPRLDNTSDPDYLIFAFDCANRAAADPNTTITVEFGADLAGWTTATHDGDNVIIDVTEGTPASRVTVKLKRSTFAPNDTLFARLIVSITGP